MECEDCKTGDLAPKDNMNWRVATKTGKAFLEVIDPSDWESYTSEQQQAYQLVTEFATEQEADKFAVGQLVSALPVRPKGHSKPKLTPVLAVPAELPK